MRLVLPSLRQSGILLLATALLLVSSPFVFAQSVADGRFFILQPNPPKKDTLLSRADAYYEAKRFTEAIADYEKYLTLNPGDEYVARKWVTCYVENNDLAGILKITTRQIATKPRNTVSYKYRGLAYLQTKNYPAAIADFTQAIDLKTDDPWVYIDLGTAYASTGDKKAYETYEKGVSLWPPYNLWMGQYYKKQADAALPDVAMANPLYDIAIAFFDKVAGKDAAVAAYNKAVALEAKAKANDNDVAVFKLVIAAWEKWIQLAPMDPELPNIKKHIEALKAMVEREG